METFYWKRSQLLAALLCWGLLFCLPVHSAHAELKLSYFGIKSGRLAFTFSRGGQKDIYVIDFQKLSVSPLVATEALEEYPSWNHDGTKVAFYSDASGDREIWVVNSDGSGLKQLTNSPGIDEDPHWSPDGKKIVFHSARAGKGSNLFVMNADGTEVTQLTNNSSKNTVPHWSPRGNEILYSTNRHWPGWDIRLFDLQTKKDQLLTSGYRSYCRGSWNPLGSAFAFSYGGGKDIDLWVQEKGGKPQRLTDMPGKEYDAEWHSGGKHIFFAGEQTKGKSDYQIFILDLDTSIASPVTEGKGAARFLSWTPFPALPQRPPEPPAEENELPRQQG